MKKFIYAVLLLLGLSIMVSSCGNSTKSNLQGYEWLEGKWKSEDGSSTQVFVRITPEYIQSVSEMFSDDMNIDNASKESYTISIVNNSFLGDLKGLCVGEGTPYFYIDDAKKAIFWIYDFDVKEYLTKE